MKMINCLINIGKRTFLLDDQLNHVKYVTVSRDTADTRMGKKEVI